VLTSYQILISPEIIVTVFLSLLSGVVVGFTLGVVGGGGSILAVPLLIYVVGISNTHIAIGTSALAVAANSIVNLLYHKRKGHVNLKQGISFAIPGAIGTLIGTQLGLLTPSQSLLALFAVFMMVISIKMLIEIKRGKHRDKAIKKFTVASDDILVNNNTIDPRSSTVYDNVSDTAITIDSVISSVAKSNSETITRRKKLAIITEACYSFICEKNKKRIILTGLLVGLSAGYFGIGGGFLIVPALIHAIPGLNMIDAIGTSLLPVSTFSSVTAARYSLSGEINLPVAILFVLGGMIGGLYGTKISSKVPRDTLKQAFAIMLIVIAIYIIIKSMSF
jgi:uncharacterized membrane protein YfcA